MAKKHPKVNPNRRMRYSHPYDIYKTLQRMKVAAKLVDGDPDAYYTETDIAAQMFENWSELSEDDQRWVILCKIHFPVRILTIMCRIEEEQVRVPDRFGLPAYKGTEKYRTRPPLFSGEHFAEWTREFKDEMERATISQTWATYTRSTAR